MYTQKTEKTGEIRFVKGDPLIKKTRLSIIVPCYNEHEVLLETSKQLYNKIQNLISDNIISHDSNIVFVDDGSTDNTWFLIKKLHEENSRFFIGIKLSKNRGHQNALLCGLLLTKDITDVAISIDADLQDDVDTIDIMLEEYHNGCEVVYGVRSNRQKDSFFKRITAQSFYRFMRFLGVDIVYNHADFRLMGKNSVSALNEYHEVNLFLRGIIPLLGYKTGIVYYERKMRFAGISKYPLSKMLKFAFEGITSFSIKPIRLITILGIFIFIISLMMIAYSIIQYILRNTISGWSSIICSLWFLGGLILLSIGIVGEYIGKNYLETKHRPRFTVEEMLYEAANEPH